MPLPKLSPLQSRLAASLIASAMLLVLYFMIASPHFAYAAEVGSIHPEDHNHERLAGPILEVDLEQLEAREVQQYEGDFVRYDNAIIERGLEIVRATGPTELQNNAPVTSSVDQGQTVQFSFLKASVYGSLSPATSGLPSALKGRDVHVEIDDGSMEGLDEQDLDGQEPELRTRQSTSPRPVYISVNVCTQPSPLINSTVDPPPQLQLYISQSAENTSPGPNQDPSTQAIITLNEGAAMHSVQATGDVYIGLYGQSTTAYQNSWSAQVAASIDGYFHTYYNSTDTNLEFADADNLSGLFYSGNLTNDVKNSTVYEAWMKQAPPFVIFANAKDDTSLNGIQNSYCGMMRSSVAPAENSTSSSRVQTAITNIGNGQPRQQFYINELSAGTTYNIALGVYGNSTAAGSGVVGGGGQVWPIKEFTTSTGAYPHLLLPTGS